MGLLEPRSLAEVRELLGRGRAVLVAGGVDVGLRLRERSLPASTDLVTLRRVEEAGLRGIAPGDESVVIGALCTHADLARHALLADRLPGLAAVFAALGNPRVRSQGTLGGNLAISDPSHDPVVALRALRASLAVDTVDGERIQPLGEPGAPALGPGDVLTRVVVPAVPPGWRLRYHKLATGAGADPGLVSVAVLAPVSPPPAGADLAPLEVVVGCVGPVPVRLPGCAAAARRFLVGSASSDDVQLAAGEELAVEPAGGHAADHRRQVAAVVVRRMVEEAFLGVGG